MHTAHQFPTTNPAPGQVIREAYRLDPPFEHEGYDPETGEDVTFHTEYVVLSNNFREVMAFPGRPVSGFVGFRPVAVKRIEVADMGEVDVITGRHRIRALLTQMGYRAVTDLNGRTTVLHEGGRVENQGRWGQGGPGSDDYMSFGE